MWYDDFVGITTKAMDQRVQEALYARGVTDAQIALYRLGYVDRKLPPLDYPPSFLSWCHRGEKLDDSIVLPLTNTLGDIRGFQFRHVEQTRKGYSDFMLEKGEAVLFGLGQAMPYIWAKRRILLVEGGFDLFPMQRYFPETTATLTAHMLDSLVRILRRVGVKDMLLAYDNDKAGRSSAEEVKKHYGDKFRVASFCFPRETMASGQLTKDPSDLWETLGEVGFSEFLRFYTKKHHLEIFDA
jgi:DNA primase